MIDATILREAFMRRFVRDSSGCWLWTHLRNGKGYGRLRLQRNCETVVILAHRFSYELFKGPIPNGLCVCHRCDVPLCVNPDHLFLGTNSDNQRDASDKGRMPSGEHHWTHRNPSLVPRGERQSGAKLTPDAVRKIREWSRMGSKQRDIAAEFHISQSMVSRLVAANRWSHL